nr:reverse transcriptase [Tanacetum cinerariifolium]
MAPTTRIAFVSNSNSNESITREYPDAQFAKMRNFIATLGLQHNQDDDVRGWAFICDQFFLIDNIPNEEKELYKATIIQRFGSVFEDPISTLKMLKMSVRMFKPTTLADNYSLTNLQKVIPEAVRKKNKPAMNSIMNKFGNEGYYGNTRKQEILPLAASTILAEEEEYDEEFVDAEDELVELSNNKLLPQISMNAGLVQTRKVRLQGRIDYIRHPPVQKDAIESMVKELLEAVESEVTRKDRLHMVIDMYEDVFEIPKQLPPIRSHDYRIPMVLGTQLVNIGPYRYPPVQKDAIESMVKELLEAGVEYMGLGGVFRACDLSSRGGYRSCKGSGYADLAST